MELKIQFFHKYQNGNIFSTHLGADFFTAVAARKPIFPGQKEILGEYDLNYNRWLKSLTSK